MVMPEETITCVDCGGVCHLLTHIRPDDLPEPGDSVAYRCSDCNDRWDVVVGEDYYNQGSEGNHRAT
ncbi:MAG: hypothetical protein ACRD0I_04440 [Acidimicrobiales bacterium]